MRLRKRTLPGSLGLALLALSAMASCSDDDSSPAGPPDTGTPPDTGACTAGARGCECAPGDTCNDGLTCDRGFCVDDGIPCPPGTAGCLCDGAACNAGLVCAGEVCVPEGCAPGTLDCNCADGDTCDDGLVCQGGLCHAAQPAGDGLTVMSTQVRGCDVLFRETGSHVGEVTFEDGITGEFLRRDGKLGVAFVTGGQVAQTVAAIKYADGQPATKATLTLDKAICVDADGEPVAGDVVSWD